MKKPKSNRHNNTKDASLKKGYNTRIRQEYIDLDYADKLDDTKKTCKLPNGKMVTELEYMSLFMKEWNNGNVGKQKDAKKNAFQRTAKDVKDCTDRTNARNRDQYGIAKARNLVHKVEATYLKEVVDSNRDINPDQVEDAMIEFLDQAKKTSSTTDNSED